MQSVDRGQYFQTDSSLSETTRKAQKSHNEAGAPIRLGIKLLAVLTHPVDARYVFVAAATGEVRVVNLVTSTTHSTLIPRGTRVPLTSLAVAITPSLGLSSERQLTLFAGSWDKRIHAWDLPLSPSKLSASTISIPSTRVLAGGHTDFVKALAVIPARTPSGTPLLVSGSADKSIAVWDAVTGQKLHTLKGHQRGVLCLAVDPLSGESEESGGEGGDEEGVILASGDSSREIRFWRIARLSAQEISAAAAARAGYAEDENSGVAVAVSAESDADGTIAPLIVHETSINSLAFTPAGDILTSSADNTAALLSRTQGYAVDTLFKGHGDFVKAAVSLAELPSDTAASTASTIVTMGNTSLQEVVASASRDEDIRFWSTSSGKEVARLKGHWEEVTGLVLALSPVHSVATPSSETETGATDAAEVPVPVLVSISIDGTVRRWGLGKEDVAQAEGEFERGGSKKEEKTGDGMLTAEEEAELAELMDESD